MSRKSACLISFLGLGPYTTTTYRLSGEGERVTASFAAVAMARFYGVERIIVLATKAASDANLELLTDELAEYKLSEPMIRELAEGGSPDQLWAQFAVVKEALREAHGSPIVFDITHGYRAQPFFASGVISFVEAMDARPYDLRVVYAPFVRDTSETPIWDLTPFVELTRWTHALSLFLKTGFAPFGGAMDESRRRVESDMEVGSARREALERLNDLADALRRFSDSVVTVRTGSLLLGDGLRDSDARALADALETSRGAVEEHLPPMADVLFQIRDLVTPLRVSGDRLNTPEGDAALVALAETYWRWRRYAEAAITLREGWITRYAADRAARPGSSRFDEAARTQARSGFHQQEPSAASGTSNVRNDIEHGGYHRRDRTAEELRTDLREWLDEFASTVRQHVRQQQTD